MESSIIEIITKMIGTVAVILVIGSVTVSSERIRKCKESNQLKYIFILGILGGLFGVYGNLSGITFKGVLLSVRDIGPMMAGFLAGPEAGLLSGFICGAHRLLIGGVSAKACIIATCLIGIICGVMAKKWKRNLLKPWVAFITGALMEAMHLTILLIMIKPFSLAWGIVKSAAFPFILVNAIGFMLMISVIKHLENQWKMNDERSRLSSELSVAEKIQRSILPVLDDSFPGTDRINVSASMDAAREIGGDFYDLFFIDENRVAFLIADVSGKGVAAALFMMNAKQTLQGCIMEKHSLSEAVTLANDRLCAGNEAEMFVTAWIGIMDLTSGDVEFVNAGHNPPVYYHNGKAEFMRERGGFVLAGMEGMPFKQKSFKMEAGDKLLIYTDGVTEAENSREEQFGEDTLLAWTDENGTKESGEIVASLRERIAQHAAGYEQSDDITMMCISLNDINEADKGSLGIVSDEQEHEEVAEEGEAVADMKNDFESGFTVRDFEVNDNTVEAVTEFSEEEMEKREIPMKMIFNFNIVIDELVSNVCKYSGASGLHLGLRITDEEITMRFEDDGDPFDPDEAGEPDLTADVEDREVGGLGLFMIKQMMDVFEYEYSDGKNIHVIKKHIG